jgi:hypothetical protein
MTPQEALAARAFIDSMAREADNLAVYVSDVEPALAEAGYSIVPTAEVERLRACFTERTDCVHGEWDAVAGDHFAEHYRAALEEAP